MYVSGDLKYTLLINLEYMLFFKLVKILLWAYIKP